MNKKNSSRLTMPLCPAVVLLFISVALACSCTADGVDSTSSDDEANFDSQTDSDTASDMESTEQPDSEIDSETEPDTASEPIVDTEPVSLELESVRLSSKIDHSCAVTDDGDVMCWGRNDSSQLGNQETHASFTPTKVSGLEEKVVSVAVGGSHTCALTESQSVYCWGGNSFGQLGAETDCYLEDVDPCFEPVPQRVEGLPSDVVAIAAGENHNCAVASDGSVRCWGINWQGQLGNGSGDGDTYEDAAIPVEVVNLGAARTVSAGRYHTCAVLADGKVACWGWNTDGQLGIGDCSGCVKNEATRVTEFTDIATSVSAGLRHTCITSSEGEIYCFGRNFEGKLDLPSGASAGRVAAGGEFTCMLSTNGDIRCFGSNAEGELGVGHTDAVDGIGDVIDLGEAAIDLAAGKQHVCAVLESGKIKCWGQNAEGQLGDGIGGTPLPMLLEEPAGRLAGDRATTCVVTAGGRLLCAGDAAVAVDDETGELLSSLSNIPTAVDGFTEDVLDVAVGYGHICALGSLGEVRCYGDNSSSEVSTDSTAFESEPLLVYGLPTNIVAVEAGSAFNLAVTEDGALWMWGSYAWDFTPNEYTHVVRDPAPPTLVEGIPLVDKAAAGYDACCAISTDGALLCAEHPEPMLDTYAISFNSIEGIPTDLVDVAVGKQHACVTDASGSVWCIGENGYGQLGDGTSCAGTNAGCPDLRFPGTYETVEVSGIEDNAIAVAAGLNHSCALTETGSVYCWGLNTSGQVGLPPSWDRQEIPTVVPGLESGVVDIHAAGNQTCALLEDGSAQCFGGNESGQLGIGRFSFMTDPVEVVSWDPSV